MLKKEILSIFQKIIEIFTQKSSQSAQEYRLGIRDLRSGINVFHVPELGSQIQGSKRHRIPDPDPQHWMVTKVS